MPKNKKKLKQQKGSNNPKGNQSGDDSSEFNADENASTISNASTNMSYQDIDSLDDQGGKLKTSDDFIEKIDNIDSQINTCLDGLLEKGFKEREDALKLMKKLFSNKYLIDFLTTKRFTLTELLLKSLKRGKTNEQIMACDVLMLTITQLGIISTDSISILNDSKQVLSELIEDEKVEPEVRAACVKALGLCVFIANDGSIDMLSVLEKFESLFAASYAKGDGTLRIHTPKMYELHTAALSTWCLLLCTMPIPFVNKLSQKHVVNFQDFLKSQDIDLRIVAGETIAFLSELAQLDRNSDTACFENDDLIEILRNLASDSSKHRSKKDKKQQRSSFRDILRTIEECEFDSQTIKFGTESLFLDNWLRRKEYETFKELLGPGMNTHLAENEYLRGLFDLGPVVQSNDQSKKLNLSSLSSKQKAQMNKEQFRNRTKSMNKKRDNKDYAQGQDYDDGGDD